MRMKGSKTAQPVKVSFSQLRNVAFLLRYGWRAAPLYMALSFFYAAYQQALIFFEHTYSIKFFTDSIQFGRPFGPVLTYIAVISALVGMSLLFGAIYYQYFQPRALERIAAGMRREFHAKAGSVDIDCYDDPAYYNDFVWVLNRAPERFEKTMRQTYNLIGAITAVLFSGVFILLTDPLGVVFVVISVVGTYVLQTRLGALNFEQDRELAVGQRRQAYVSRVFYTADAAKEIRLTPVSDELLGMFDASGAEMEATVRRRAPRMARLGFLGEFAFSRLTLDGLYVLWVVYRVLVRHDLTYGDIVALFHSTSRMKNCLENAASFVAEFGEAALFVEKARTFLARPARLVAPAAPRPLPSGEWTISLRDVCFGYPGSERLILDHVSLDIPSGQSLALVGHNGAGKTSLVKLLMRLYDPTSGAILVNGIDIREFDPAAYRERVGVIFQDFQLFAASVAENVAMDRLPEDDPRLTSVRASLVQSGFGDRLTKMGAGLATPLTREFDDAGENLSGGEAQKLAIARVVHKTAALSILDEPSSALDPISEYQLNETMQQASRGSTVVYISHRLSTTRLAGLVCLLEGGRIVERGTHDELMRLGGAYSRMFNLQAARYRPPVEA